MTAPETCLSSQQLQFCSWRYCCVRCLRSTTSVSGAAPRQRSGTWPQHGKCTSVRMWTEILWLTFNKKNAFIIYLSYLNYEQKLILTLATSIHSLRGKVVKADILRALYSTRLVDNYRYNKTRKHPGNALFLQTKSKDYSGLYSSWFLLGFLSTTCKWMAWLPILCVCFQVNQDLERLEEVLSQQYCMDRLGKPEDVRYQVGLKCRSI